MGCARPDACGWPSRSPPRTAARSPAGCAATSSPAPTRRRRRSPTAATTPTRSSIPTAPTTCSTCAPSRPTRPPSFRARRWRFAGASTDHARRRLRGRTHLRRRLPRPRSARRRRGPGRHARPRQLLQARDGRRRQSVAGPPARHRLGRVADRPLPAPLRLRGLQRRRAAAAASSTACSIRWAAPGAASFNHRFGQQSRDQLQHFNIHYPVDMFPFTDADQTDPRPARPTACWRARDARNTVPQIFHLLTDSEYFNRAGSLVHTDVDRHARRAAAADEPHLHRGLGAAHRRRRSRRRRLATRTSSARPT